MDRRRLLVFLACAHHYFNMLVVAITTIIAAYELERSQEREREDINVYRERILARNRIRTEELERVVDDHVSFGESQPSVGVHVSGGSFSSPSSSKKRKRSSENFGELMGVLENISREAIQCFRKVGEKLEENLSKEVWQVLDTLNLTQDEKVDAAFKFGNNSGLSQMLLIMTPAVQICFVRRVIR